jgi:hypothetical protein
MAGRKCDKRNALYDHCVPLPAVWEWIARGRATQAGFSSDAEDNQKDAAGTRLAVNLDTTPRPAANLVSDYRMSNCI